jgi:hypothetical protein
VAKRKGDFVYTDEDELRLEKAARKAKIRAQRLAASKNKSKNLSQSGGDPTAAILSMLAPRPPAPPALPPIIDPTQQLLAGLASDVRGARGSTERQFSEAQKALGNISGDPGVAGANASDVYMGGLSGIAGAQRGLGTQISSDVAEFVLKQMQDRVSAQQQYQNDVAGFQRQQAASPSQIAQLASMGLLGQVDLSNPIAVQMAIQGGGREISNSLKVKLHESGIDWRDYQYDDLGARLAISDKNKKLGGSDAELRRLLQEALK